MSAGKNIILAGFMGSGKSSVGKLLARKLDYTFIDLDDAIENSAGLKISEIFKQFGEEYFRKLETEKLKSLQAGNRQVISLGGGAFCSETNISLAKKLGFTVYLKSSFSSLISRYTPEERSKRPLLKDITKAEALLQQRELFYQQADLTVITDNSSPESISEVIVKYFKN